MHWLPIAVIRMFKLFLFSHFTIQAPPYSLKEGCPQLIPETSKDIRVHGNE